MDALPSPPGRSRSFCRPLSLSVSRSCWLSAWRGCRWRRGLTREQRAADFGNVAARPELREKVGQIGFLAALSGFRTLVADLLWIEAHDRLGTGGVRQDEPHVQTVTTLAPHNVNFWDMASWHMAYNASVAVMEDRKQPKIASGARSASASISCSARITSSTASPTTRSPLRLYQHARRRSTSDKFDDHCAASAAYDKAAACPHALDLRETFRRLRTGQVPRPRARGLATAAHTLRHGAAGTSAHPRKRPQGRWRRNFSFPPEQRVYKTP